jgi:hypothetical protein
MTASRELAELTAGKYAKDIFKEVVLLWIYVADFLGHIDWSIYMTVSVVCSSHVYYFLFYLSVTFYKLDSFCENCEIYVLWSSNYKWAEPDKY